MNEPLKALEELGDQFERAAYAAGGPRRGRRARRRRVLCLAVLGALLVAATAMAASGLLTGEPVRNPAGVTFKADEGLGKPLPDQNDLLDLRVPDPAGGPPWGMRTVRTTRGLGCVQVGRVVDDKLGVLGRNGAFGDDGRFHELPADVLTGPTASSQTAPVTSSSPSPTTACPPAPFLEAAEPQPSRRPSRSPAGPGRRPCRPVTPPRSASCTSACSALRPKASPSTTTGDERPPGR
jgi:hypothetical protein